MHTILMVHQKKYFFSLLALTVFLPSCANLVTPSVIVPDADSINANATQSQSNTCPDLSGAYLTKGIRNSPEEKYVIEIPSNSSLVFDRFFSSSPWIMVVNKNGSHALISPAQNTINNLKQQGKIVNGIQLSKRSDFTYEVSMLVDGGVASSYSYTFPQNTQCINGRYQRSAITHSGPYGDPIPTAVITNTGNQIYLGQDLSLTFKHTEVKQSTFLFDTISTGSGKVISYFDKFPKINTIQPVK